MDISPRPPAADKIICLKVSHHNSQVLSALLDEGMLTKEWNCNVSCTEDGAITVRFSFFSGNPNESGKHDKVMETIEGSLKDRPSPPGSITISSGGNPPQGPTRHAQAFPVNPRGIEIPPSPTLPWGRGLLGV